MGVFKTILTNIFLIGLISIIISCSYSTKPDSSEALSNVKDSVYIIRPNGFDGGQGSGIAIDDGLIVTAWHVLVMTYNAIPRDQWDDHEVDIYKSRTSAPYKATLVSYDAVNDVAILSSPDLECPCTPIKDMWVFDKDVLYAAYHLSRISNVIFIKGHLINKSTTSIHSTNAIYFGASGGGLLAKKDGQYYVVGIIRAMPVAANGYPLNYIAISTPSTHAIKLLSELE